MSYDNFFCSVLLVLLHLRIVLYVPKNCIFPITNYQVSNFVIKHFQTIILRGMVSNQFLYIIDTVFPSTSPI